MTSEVLAAGDAPTSDARASGDAASDAAAVPQHTVSDDVEHTRSVASSVAAKIAVGVATAREVGGREGPEPTRYGDWEMRGRCIDF